MELGGLNGDKELSEETKRKIGDAHKGRYTEAQWAATIARRGKGHPQSEESKKKIGDAHRGRHLSEEQKKHLSEINIGRKMSEAHKEKLRKANMKKIDQFDLDGNYIATHESIRSAAKSVGILHQCISACCRGVASRAGNYLWRYAV